MISGGGILEKAVDAARIEGHAAGQQICNEWRGEKPLSSVLGRGFGAAAAGEVAVAGR
jgi:hypothetical protein